MKSNWVLIISLALITTPFAAAAHARPASQTAPNAAILTSIHNGDAAALKDVLAVQPPVPIGPPDLLKAYEDAMASTAQGFNAQVSQILEAVQQKRISEEQGEYLCKEAYQLAMMQFQVFSGLHDMLADEVSQTSAAAQSANPAAAAGINGSNVRNTIHRVASIGDAN